MSFATGSALWWLLPLAGTIVLLYLLKMRRRDFVVPATFLWPALTYEVRANSLFQRLRLSLLLFLQLLALALVVFALARPQMRERGLGGEVTVLVLDTSASMAANEGSGTRLDEALSLCRNVIDSARAGDRVALIEAGPSPRVVFSLSSDPGRMRRALTTVRQTDAIVDIGEALRLAASITAKRSRARIVLLSDGVFDEVRNFASGNASLEFVPVGKGTENVAVTALAAAPSLTGRSVFCAVKNFGQRAATVTLHLSADGKAFNVKQLTIRGGESHGETFDTPVKAEVLEARIEGGGALAADDWRVALADPSAVLRVLLVGKGDLFMERALALDARVVLDRASTLPVSAQPGSAGDAPYDVIVFEGTPEVPVRAKGVLTWGAAGAPSPVRRLGIANAPRLRSADTAHPLLDAVDFQGTYIERGERVEAKPEGIVLAQSSAGPLVVASEGAQRHVYVAFAPLESDFPLQIAFPIFLANALDYLAPRVSRGDSLATLAGQTFSLPAPDANATIRLDGPNGPVEIKPTGGAFVVRGAVRAGTYTLDLGQTKRRLFANFADERESAIAPVKHVMAGGAPTAGSTSILRLSDTWRWFALFALAVLAGEWWLFARRS